MPLCKLIHWISGDVNLDLLVSSIDDIVGLATASKQNSWCKFGIYFFFITSQRKALTSKITDKLTKLVLSNHDGLSSPLRK